jgi:GNAT superfamily N-acetyltransferase
MLTPAAEHDLAALVALFGRAFEGYVRDMAQPPVDWQPRVAAALRTGNAMWTPDRHGAVLLRLEGSTLTVDALAIDPARQGKGLGISALRAIEDHATQLGATEIALHTAQQFTPLVAFYSRAGYRVQAVGPHPRGRGDRLHVFLVKSPI